MAKRGRKSKRELLEKGLPKDITVREEIKNDKGEVINVIETQTHDPGDIKYLMEYLTSYCGNRWKK